MKRKILLLALLALSFSAFSQKHFDISKFEQKDGVLYQTERSNPDGKLAKEGDMMIGRFQIYYDDSLVFNGLNNPSRPMFPVLQKNSIFKGDLIYGLKFMHQGERITFAFPADSMQKYPQTGVAKDLKIDYIYYRVIADSLVSMEEFEAAERLQREKEQKEADSLRKIEPNLISKFLTDNNWDTNKVEGIYVHPEIEGVGEKPTEGDTIYMHYAGRLLNGKYFDTSIDSIARKEHMYNSQRKYEPIVFKLGAHQMISGFEIAAKQLRKGGKATVLLPSHLAYGGRSMGLIKAYSPLIFEVELVDFHKGEPLPKQNNVIKPTIKPTTTNAKAKKNTKAATKKKANKKATAKKK